MRLNPAYMRCGRARCRDGQAPPHLGGGAGELENFFTREQDWDSAIRFFIKALDLKLGDPYALNNLGAASAKSGDEASALRHFEAAIEANPHFPEPRFGKALLLKNQGHLDAAEALESLLRDASPGDARSNPVFQKAEQLHRGRTCPGRHRNHARPGGWPAGNYPRAQLRHV